MQAHVAIAQSVLRLLPSGTDDFRIENHRASVAQKLSEFRDHGIKLSGLELRETPVGLRSRDVDEFMGRLLIVGQATHESPIRITQTGVDLLVEIVRAALTSPETREETLRAAQVIGLDLSQFENVTR